MSILQTPTPTIAADAAASLDDIITAAYDGVPYESFPFPQSAPEHLRAVAQLFGLSAPPVATARVLELGCSAGGNLLPLARRHPGARLVGVDLSPIQIAQGRAVIEAEGLANAELRQASIADIDASWGRFDYIVCHGVYSWVPPEVQQAILRVCAENLSDEGVAYVSYNTYPGWKFREILRDAMLLRGSGRRTPAEQLAYARGMVDFLHERAAPGSALKVALDENVPILRQSKDYYLMHEFLEPCNAPCYFKDFLQAASAHGLGYVAEADIPLMFTRNQPPAVAEPLLRECGTQVELEQYLDFVGNRSFRQTLLVHAARQAGVRYRLDAERLQALHVAGVFQPQAPAEGQGGDTTHYTDWRRNTVGMNTPLAQAVAAELDGLYPGTCSLDALAQAVAKRLKQPARKLQEPVAKLVEELLIRGNLRFRADPLACATTVPARPKRSPQAFTWSLPPAEAGGEPRRLACNGWHEAVSLNLVESHLLAWSDGERDRAALLDEIQGLLARGELHFLRDGVAIKEPEARDALAQAQLDAGLQRLTRCGLLEA